MGKPIPHDHTYQINSMTSPATFSATIGYTDIYPACALVLYEQNIDKLEEITAIKRQEKEQI